MWWNILFISSINSLYFNFNISRIINGIIRGTISFVRYYVTIWDLYIGTIWNNDPCDAYFILIIWSEERLCRATDANQAHVCRIIFILQLSHSRNNTSYINYITFHETDEITSDYEYLRLYECTQVLWWEQTYTIHKGTQGTSNIWYRTIGEFIK